MSYIHNNNNYEITNFSFTNTTNHFPIWGVLGFVDHRVFFFFQNFCKGIMGKKVNVEAYLCYPSYSSHEFGFMAFKATFNNISVISWRSVLLVEETGRPKENHRPAASHWQTLSHNVVHLALSGSRTHNTSGDRHRLLR